MDYRPRKTYIRPFFHAACIWLCCLVGAYAQPPNDDVANAIPVAADSLTAGTIVDATVVSHCSCAYSDDHDVWYSYAAAESGPVVVSMRDNVGIYPTLSVFDGDTLEEIVCGYRYAYWDPMLEVSFGATSGKTYLIRVAGYYSWDAFDFLLRVMAHPPENDECSNAIPVLSESVVAGATVAATGNEPACGYSDTKEVWYVHTADVTGNVTLDLRCISERINMTLAVYDGCCGNQLAYSSTVCRDRVRVDLSVVTGLSYWINVAALNNHSAAFELSVLTTVPANDECSGAIPLELDMPFADNNIAATGADETSCQEGDGKSVWYSYTAAQDGEVAFHGSDLAMWPIVTLFDSCGGNELACYRGRWWVGRPVYCPVTASTTYYISVSDGDDCGGDFTITASLVTPPANDDCANANALSESNYIDGNTWGATGADVSSCGTGDGDDVWYSLVASRTATAIVRVNNASESDLLPVVSVFDACAGSEITCIAGEEARFTAIEGASYWVRVAGDAGTHGDFNIHYDLADPPANDLCENAVWLTENQYVTADLSAATGTDLTSCGNDPYDIWYTFTAAMDGIARIETLNNLTVTLAVFDACGGNELTCSINPGAATFAATEGSTYWVRCGGTGSCWLQYAVDRQVWNDDCSNAVPLSKGNNGSFLFQGVTGNDETSCGSEDRYDEWFSYTPATDETVSILLGTSSYSTVEYSMAVFDSCGGTELACAAGRQIILPFLGGTTYLVRVGNTSGYEDSGFTIAVEDVPGNDNCADAIPLTPDTTTPGTNRGASTDGNGSCVPTDGSDVWYTFTPPSTGPVTLLFGLSGDYDWQCDATLSVFDGCVGAELACNDDTVNTRPAITMDMTAGNTYWIRVACKDPAHTGAFTIRAVTTAPSNDECAAALSIQEDVPVNGTTAGATGTDISPCGDSDVRDVWYVYTPTVTGDVAVCLSIPYSAASLSIFDACGGACLACTATPGLSIKDTMTHVALSVTAGTDYFIRVANYDDVCDFSLRVSTEIPANDECTQAVALVDDIAVAGTTVNAAGVDETSCGTGGDRNVWYSYTAPTSGDAYIWLTPVYPGTMDVSVLDGCSDAELFCATAWASTTYHVSVLSGTTLFVALAYENQAMGDFVVQAGMVTPPSNDDCANATQLQEFDALSGSNMGATGADVSSCGAADDKDVWFWFMPLYSGTAIINVTPEGVQGITQPTSSVYASCGGSELDCHNAGTYSVQSRAEVQAGQVYLVRVASDSGGRGNFTINYQLQEPPANDHCEDATELPLGTSVDFSTVGATGTDLTSCGIDDAYDVWYTYTPNWDGVAAIQKYGSGTMAVFDGCGGSELACRDDGPNWVDWLHCPVLGGIPYLLRVTGGSGLRAEVYPSAPNDECANAQDIDKNIEYWANTGGAFGTDLTSCVDGDEFDVWYAYTPVANEDVTMAMLGNPFVFSLSVFDGCAGNELACTNLGRLSLAMSAGQRYLIRVASAAGGGVSLMLADTPPNDECSGAIPIQAGDVVSGTTIFATDSGIPSTCNADEMLVQDLWYSFSPQQSGAATVTLEAADHGSHFSPFFSVHDACGGNQMVCNADGLGVPAEAGWVAEAGHTYYVRFANQSGITGDFTFRLSLAALPSQTSFQFQRLWPTLQQPWYFSTPGDIDISPDGIVNVCDGRYVWKLTPEGRLVSNIGLERTATAAGRSFRIAAAEDDRTWVFRNEGFHVGNYCQEGAWAYYDLFDFAADGTTESLWRIGWWSFFQDACNGTYSNNSAGYHLGSISADRAGNLYGLTGLELLRFSPDSRPEADLSFPVQGGAFDMDVDGNFYVGDYFLLRKYDATGALQIQWGSEGSGPLEFSASPIPAVAPDGTIFTAEPMYEGPTRVQHFTSSGGYMGEWLTDEPVVDMAAHPDGTLWATGGTNPGVVQFSPTGDLLGNFSCIGSEPGMFRNVGRVVWGPDSTLFVVDTGNNRIQEFSPDGAYLRTWGADLNLNGPTDLAFERSGAMLVVDPGNYRIVRISPTGAYVDEWATPQFGAICVDRHGPEDRILVTEGAGVREYTPDGTLVASWNPSVNYYTYGAGLAVDDLGYIYVSTASWSESISGRSEWGTLHKLSPELSELDSMTLDGRGDIYVDEWQRIWLFGLRMRNVGYNEGEEDRGIWVYWSGGSLAHEWILEEGTAPGQVQTPSGITLDPSGNLYLSDLTLNRVQKLSPVAYTKRSKAIIVAGGGPGTWNGLWDATQVCANFAYRALTYQGFTKDSIYYISANTPLDLDENGVADDVDGPNTNAQLQYALETWASAPLGGLPTGDLVVYVVDHGNVGSFRMGELETLSVSDLESWLDTAQAGITGKVMVVYDACHSGSFISMLGNNPNRIVVASSASDEVARFVTDGTISFSSFFWTQVFNGVPVRDCFDLASSSLNQTYIYQMPLLDDTGNGVGNEATDGLASATTFIGNGTPQNWSGPVIGGVIQPPPLLDTSAALLSVGPVTDSDGVVNVWAVIHPPDYGTTTAPGVALAGLPSAELHPTGSDDRWEGTFEGFTSPGTYRVLIYARDRIGNTSLPTETSVIVQRAVSRKALIVAGVSAPNGGLWPAVEFAATAAYHALRFQGYSDADIYFLSQSTTPGVDGLTVLSNVRWGLTQWAALHTQDVVLYLVGEGQPGAFVLNDSEALTAAQFDMWLDQLQTEIPGRVTVVYDGSYSGSFLSTLLPDPDKSRVTILSTSPTQQAVFQGGGEVSFSKYFWTRVLNGATVGAAFQDAANGVNFSGLGQLAMLDYTGDGVFNTKQDMAVLLTYRIGAGILLAGDPPVIGAISPAQDIVGASGTVWVDNVTTTGAIVSVTGVVLPPGADAEYLGPKGSVLLSPVGDGRYEGTFSGFDENGTFTIIVTATDAEDNVSSPMQTTVTRLDGPDAYEDDDGPGDASWTGLGGPAQHHTFHDSGDEDWVEFYGQAGQTVNIQTLNLGPMCDTVVELYQEDGLVLLDSNDEGLLELGASLLEFVGNPPTDPGLPADGFYLVRVTQSLSGPLPGFGVGVYYDVSVWDPSTTSEPASCRVTAKAPGGTGLAGADLLLTRLTPSYYQTEYQTGQDGSCSLEGLAPGSYEFSVSGAAIGYGDSGPQPLILAEGDHAQRDVTLSPLGLTFRWGDVNEDGRVGTMDASQIWQWLAGPPPGEYPPNADVDGVNGVDNMDAVAILKKRIAQIRSFPADVDMNGYGPEGKSLGGATLTLPGLAGPKADKGVSVAPLVDVASPGDTRTFAIQLDDASGLLGYYLELDYDPAVILCTGVAKGAVGTGHVLEHLLVNDAQPGHLVLASAGTEAAGAIAGSLIEVTFTVRSTAIDGDITSIELFGVDFNDGAHTASTAGAELQVVAPAPSIVAQPEGGEAHVGDMFTFRVAVSDGRPPLRYEWYKDGVLVPELEGPELVLSPLTLSHAGWYWVVVTDDLGRFIESNHVQLSVTLGLPVVSRIVLASVVVLLSLAGIWVERRHRRGKQRS